MLGSRDAMAKVVEDALTRFGRIDVLINNAGVYPRQPFLEMTEEQWDTMQDINLKSVFHCTKLVMPHMVRQRAGAVVNISSVTFFTGLQNLTHYIASKGAIIGFTRGLAREMGEHNVRVNCITPGAIETEGERKLCQAGRGHVIASKALSAASPHWTCPRLLVSIDGVERCHDRPDTQRRWRLDHVLINRAERRHDRPNLST